MPYRDPDQRKAYHKAYSKAWAAANPEKILAHSRAYEEKRCADPVLMEKRRERDRKRPRNGTPELKDILRRYYADNTRAFRDRRLRKMYGITLEQYEAMLAAQSGCCAICGSADPMNSYGTFHTDHDHLTGAVRALLCRPCNMTVGHAKEDANRLRKCADYIERHRALLEIV